MLAYDPRRGSVAPINTFNFKRKLLGPPTPHTHTHIHMGGGEKGWRFWRGSGGLARFYEVLLTAGIYTKSNEMFNKHFALRKSQ